MHSIIITMNFKYKPIYSNVWKPTNRIRVTFTFAFPVLNNHILSQPMFHVCCWLFISCLACWHFSSVTIIPGCFLCIRDSSDAIRWCNDGAFSLFIIITAKLHINKNRQWNCTRVLILRSLSTESYPVTTVLRIFQYLYTINIKNFNYAKTTSGLHKHPEKTGSHINMQIHSGSSSSTRP